MFVICAGCGKKYKAEPGLKRFQCKQCGNLFTAQAKVRAPAEGKRLCSCCWNEVPSKPAALECQACGQKVSTPEGGLMLEEGGSEGAADSGAREPVAPIEQPKHPTPQARPVVPRQSPSGIFETRVTQVLEKSAVEDKEKARLLRDLRGLMDIRRELEVKVHTLESEAVRSRNVVAEAQAARDAAVQAIEEVKAERDLALAQLDEVREVVTSALEPLPGEFEAGMRESLQQAGDVSFLANRALRALPAGAASPDAQEQFKKLEAALRALEDNLRDWQGRFTTRLREVLGGPGESEK